MAMDLVTGAVGSLISKLGKLLSEEYKLQKGVAEKLGSLIKELECAHAALRELAGVPPDQLHEQVRIWAREVREASYDMEDVLDAFLVSAKQMDNKSLFEYLKRKMTDIYNMVVSGPLKRRKIAVTVDDINKRLQEVTQRHRRYTGDSFVSKPSPTSTIDPRLQAMYKEVTELTGIEKPSADLISMLSLTHEDEASNKKMKIISIIGTGGLGKTTLTKAVYDKVKVGFQCQAFVTVGRDPNLKKVFRDILIEFDRNKYTDTRMTILDEKQLIDELREYLGSKRYFIVIDDIWEIKSWETIRLALVHDNCGISRVITTTRSLEVARECGEVYKLEPLRFDESKRLFYTRIFGSEGKNPDIQLDEASNKILKKCDGVPLAIITMASLLVGKSRKEWIEVCHSIIFRDKNNQQVSDTEWILSLSYYDLPDHLKTCLLYLSAFPEDYVIDKDPLIRKWIAEGFVHGKEPETSLFEIGEGYFNELVNRSMIQTVELEGDDMVWGCRLHDMVHDILRVRSQEENFITISCNTRVGEGTSSSRNRVRRLVHQNKTEEQTHQGSLLGMDLRHVRTFIACNCDTIIVDEVLSFRLLRVLALEDCRGVSLEHVEKLLHLRYLGIFATTIIGELPEGIGALKFLQTLEMRRRTNKNVPASLGLLTQLTCLRAGAQMVPNRVIDKLTSLEELQISCPDHMVGPLLKELGKLHELRVLHFTDLVEFDKSMQSDFVDSLGVLHKIRHLTLTVLYMSIRLEKAIWDAAVLPRPLLRLNVPMMHFTAMPSCINPLDLPKLTHLELYVEDLDEQGLKNLGALPELRHLELRTMSTVAITISNEASDGFFHKLRFYRLPYSTALFKLNEDLSVSFTIWRSNGDDAVAFASQMDIARTPAVMPNLQVLYFSVDVQALIRNNGSCDKLGLEYLPSLQRVRVELWCHNVFSDDMERQEAALRHAIEVHPNRPTLRIDFE